MLWRLVSVGMLNICTIRRNLHFDQIKKDTYAKSLSSIQRGARFGGFSKLVSLLIRHWTQEKTTRMEFAGVTAPIAHLFSSLTREHVG